MRILVHCDGGPAIGVGHAVRALALAEEASAAGHEVTIVGDLTGDLLDELLVAAPAEVRRVPRGDLEGLVAVVEDVAPDVVHVDSYEEVPGSWPGSPLRSNVEDGAYGRRAADLTIDPNLGAERAPRGPGATGVALRGARFAMLRSVVTGHRGRWRRRPEARRVLVVMGGSDATGITPAVLRALVATGLPLEVTVLVRSEVARELTTVGHGSADVTVRAPVPDLPSLAVQQDLVVSAAGTTVWELCCLGVPMALVPVVDNQRTGFARVVEAGAALPIDELATGDADQDRAVGKLRALLEDPGARRRLSENAATLVDGLGAWRVVRAWEHLVAADRSGGSRGSDEAARRDSGGVDVRPATLDDADLLLQWRNDPATRAMSRSSEEVGRPGHLRWLEASLSSPDRMLLVATSGDSGEPVGTLRWDRVEATAWEVAVTVAPEQRGQGWARPLLETGEQELIDLQPEVTALVAVVHEGNAPSRRLFAGCGYLPDHPADANGFLTLRKPL